MTIKEMEHIVYFKRHCCTYSSGSLNSIPIRMPSTGKQGQSTDLQKCSQRNSRFSSTVPPPGSSHTDRKDRETE